MIKHLCQFKAKDKEDGHIAYIDYEYSNGLIVKVIGVLVIHTNRCWLRMQLSYMGNGKDLKY